MASRPIDVTKKLPSRKVMLELSKSAPTINDYVKSLPEIFSPNVLMATRKPGGRP